MKIVLYGLTIFLSLLLFGCSKDEGVPEDFKGQTTKTEIVKEFCDSFKQEVKGWNLGQAIEVNNKRYLPVMRIITSDPEVFAVEYVQEQAVIRMKNQCLSNQENYLIAKEVESYLSKPLEIMVLNKQQPKSSNQVAIEKGGSFTNIFLEKDNLLGVVSVKGNCQIARQLAKSIYYNDDLFEFEVPPYNSILKNKKTIVFE